MKEFRAEQSCWIGGSTNIDERNPIHFSQYIQNSTGKQYNIASINNIFISLNYGHSQYQKSMQCADVLSIYLLFVIFSFLVKLLLAEHDVSSLSCMYMYVDHPGVYTSNPMLPLG